MSDEQETGNIKSGPHIEFMIGDDLVLLRPYVYGWELCYRRKVKDTIIWQGEKFFATLEQSIKSIFEYQLRVCDAKNFEELRGQITKIREELVSVYNTNIKEVKGTK